MKRILAPALVFVVLVITALLNPSKTRHQDRIAARYTAQNPLTGPLIGSAFAQTVSHHNYVLFSTTTLGEERISVGFLGFVNVRSLDLADLPVYLIDFRNTVSIYRTILILFGDGHYLPSVTVLTFSVLFPTGKIFLEAYVWFREGVTRRVIERLHGWIDMVSKLSMTEIFVAAILIALVKFGVFAEVQVHAGVYFLLASVLLSLWASLRLGRVLTLTSLDERSVQSRI